MWKRPLEFLKFSLVGAVNTGVDFTVFTVLTNLGVLILVAQCISYTCGVLNSFLLNRTWTFRGCAQSSKSFLRFLLLNLGTLIVTYILLVYFHNNLGLSILFSKLLATSVSLFINFTGSRFLVFS
ncbi:MAG: GtrA family protein [Bacillota bacterium]|nr:GtrA family protein [Bacillota bacterium]